MRNLTPQTQAALRRQALVAARNPWTLLLTGLTLLAAIVFGLPILLGASVVALVAGTAVTGQLLSGSVADEPKALDPSLRPGTEQAELVVTLDGYIKDLRDLRAGRISDVVKDPAIEAPVAATSARTGAIRTAAAVDALDGALTRSRTVSGRWSGSGTGREIGDSVARMAARRTALLGKLQSAVGEIAEVYTKLLELSATISDTSLTTETSELAGITDALESLRVAFAELEAAGGNSNPQALE